MNPQPLDDDQDSSHVELGEGVGRRLRAARVDRGLDLDRIAAQLHLKASLVDALEAGRYEALPGPVFVAGYIRNYARQVGLDPEPLVAAYAAAPEPDRTRPGLGPAPDDPRDHGASGFLIRVMTVVLVAGLAYLFVQWWQSRAPAASDLAGEPAWMPDPNGPDATQNGQPPGWTSRPLPGLRIPALAQRAMARHSETQPPDAVGRRLR